MLGWVVKVDLNCRWIVTFEKKSSSFPGCIFFAHKTPNELIRASIQKVIHTLLSHNCRTFLITVTAPPESADLSPLKRLGFRSCPQTQFDAQNTLLKFQSTVPRVSHPKNFPRPRSTYRSAQRYQPRKHNSVNHFHKIQGVTQSNRKLRTLGSSKRA